MSLFQIQPKGLLHDLDVLRCGAERLGQVIQSRLLCRKNLKGRSVREAGEDQNRGLTSSICRSPSSSATPQPMPRPLPFTRDLSSPTPRHSSPMRPFPSSTARVMPSSAMRSSSSSTLMLPFRVGLSLETFAINSSSRADSVAAVWLARRVRSDVEDVCVFESEAMWVLISRSEAAWAAFWRVCAWIRFSTAGKPTASAGTSLASRQRVPRRRGSGQTCRDPDSRAPP